MDKRLQTLLMAAQGALEVGNRESAAKTLRQILDAEPYMAEAWYLLSLAVDPDHYEDQVTCLRNALFIDPDMPAARERLDALDEQGVTTTAWQTRRTIPLLDDLRDEEIAAANLFSKVEDYGKDPLDDPLQCPYCGTVNPVENTVCTGCGRKIVFYEPRASRSGPQLQLAVLLGGIAAILGIFEISTALLWQWFGASLQETGSLLEIGVGGALDSPGGRFLFGDLLREDFLTETAANVLVIGGIARIVSLAVAWYGAYNRWRWGYYAAVILLILDVVFQVVLSFLGLTGLLVSIVTAILSAGALVTLFVARTDFSLNQARVAVEPDTRARSAAAYYERGMRLKDREMWAAAVAHWRKAVGASPRTSEYYRWLGIGYLKLKRYDRAIPVLEEGLRLKPDDAQFAELLAQTRDIIAGKTHTEDRSLIEPLWEDPA
ncbi:MAG: tetratricopeptide repeat protein [Anaerolineae bacterium]|nr:tetratricopeptide repeat protein [Anaerolineae bacterium]